MAWGLSGLVGTRSTRVLGSRVSLAWGMIAGFAVVLVPALLTLPRHAPQPTAYAWLAVGASASAAGLFAMFHAYRIADLSIVAPIIACEGAVVALLDVAFGGPLGAPRAALLTLATLGVAVVARGTERSRRTTVAPARAIAASILAAVCYGLGLFCAAKASHQVGPFVPGLVTRLVGLATITAPVLVATRAVVASRSGLRLALLGGALDISGMLLYVGSARAGTPAVAGVLVSQAAAVSALLGVLVLGERVVGRQLAGFAMIVVAISGLGYGV